MIRLDCNGRDVTGCPFGESPDDAVFPWNGALAPHFEQFYRRMPKAERELAFHCVRLGWTTFPVGRQMIAPDEMSVWDVVILDSPFHGERSQDEVKWDKIDKLELSNGDGSIEVFYAWTWKRLKFFKLDPGWFEAFVNGTKLCLESETAKSRRARFELTKAWFKATSAFNDEPPF